MALDGSRLHAHIYNMKQIVTLVLFCLAAVIVLSSCGFPAWRDQALRDVAEGRWHVDPEQVQGSGQSSRTIEYYDAAGRHLGYGTTSGGSINIYGPDGSRPGSGRR